VRREHTAFIEPEEFVHVIAVVAEQQRKSIRFFHAQPVRIEPSPSHQGRSRRIVSEIARELSRHRSTICRELKRNSARWDGHYRPSKAIERTAGRRSRSRRNQRFTRTDLRPVETLLRERWSPQQICGRLRDSLRISHETIYRHVWRDRMLGGSLYTYLRGARKKRRNRYGAYDSRGRLAGKRHNSERPPAAKLRSEIGHWEIDTVIGKGDHHCLLSVVDRKTGYVVIGKLRARNKRTHQSPRSATHASPPPALQNHHRRKRHRVPRLRRDRASHWHRVLLRHSPSLVGARDQRKHQRLDPPVRA
jgi:IS30 family transposase